MIEVYVLVLDDSLEFILDSTDITTFFPLIRQQFAVEIYLWKYTSVSDTYVSITSSKGGIIVDAE